MLVAPKKIDDHVRALCSKIRPGQEPIRVPVQAERGSRINECFFNVRAKMQKDGGDILHGWTIWEKPGLFIEAEFHAIWRSDSGELLDVSPKVDGEKEILFLPDSSQIFDESSFNRRDNVRLATCNSPVVHDFIRCAEEFFRYKEASTVPNNPKMMRLNVDVCDAYKRRMLELQNTMEELPIGRNDICRCGSGKKYKKCCMPNRL